MDIEGAIILIIFVVAAIFAFIAMNKSSKDE